MKNAFTVLTTALCIALLAGCYVSNREIKYSIKGAVPVGTAISVATPEDGIYMEDVYPNSGKVVARKLVAALTPYYPGSAVSSTGTRGVYVIEPKILHWEDRATEWSGKADRVKVSLPLLSLWELGRLGAGHGKQQLVDVRRRSSGGFTRHSV